MSIQTSFSIETYDMRILADMPQIQLADNITLDQAIQIFSKTTFIINRHTLEQTDKHISHKHDDQYNVTWATQHIRQTRRLPDQ